MQSPKLLAKIEAAEVAEAKSLGITLAQLRKQEKQKEAERAKQQQAEYEEMCAKNLKDWRKNYCAGLARELKKLDGLSVTGRFVAFVVSELGAGNRVKVNAIDGLFREFFKGGEQFEHIKHGEHGYGESTAASLKGYAKDLHKGHKGESHPMLELELVGMLVAEGTTRKELQALVSIAIQEHKSSADDRPVVRKRA